MNSLPNFKPMQFRGPSPNGKNGISTIVLPCKFALKNRLGSNSSGFGKYLLSRCKDNTGIKMDVPFSSVIFDSGTLYDFVHSLRKNGVTGYLRRVSKIMRKKSSKI